MFKLARALIGRPASVAERMEEAQAAVARGALDAARVQLEKALEQEPRNADAHLLLGRIAQSRRLYEKAVEHLYCSLGGALHKAKRFADAGEVFLRGLEASGEHVTLLVGRAAALIKLKRLDEALPLLERAGALAPHEGVPHFGIGSVHLDLGRVEESIAAFRLAHERMPEHTGVHSKLLFLLNYSARLSQDQILAEHRRFGALEAQPVRSPRLDETWPRRLRVGYVSQDFRAHVVSNFMLPVIARHDRARFEVFCYFNHEDADHVTDSFRELADHWRECVGKPASEIAQIVRADGIDILIDLAGHTGEVNLKAFALRPAPVQITYLGYPNTTGLRAMDYRISDAMADPPGEADHHHAERLLRLPRTFLCYRPGPHIDVAPLPAAGAGRVTFGCFNNILKLSPPFFDAAVRILNAVPAARLLLKNKVLGNLAAQAEVRARFTAAGIDESRVVLSAWEPSVEGHLKAYDQVDVALDSFPYNGTTTTCEALWMGVPVVTFRGDRHAGRVGASLLHTVGLDDLVGDTIDDYVKIAVSLSADPGRLAGLRAGLRTRMRASALMDETGFVRELEACYLEVWERRLKAQTSPKLDQAALERLAGEARHLADSGHADDAKRTCVDVLASAPANMPALTLLWDLCHADGDLGLAVEAVGAAIGEAGPTARMKYMLGCSLQELNRLREAAAAYREALGMDGRHAKAANNLGAVLEMLGDLDGARSAYDQALAAEPGLAMALANRGNLRGRRGDVEGAREDLRQALRLDPGRTEWQESLAELEAPSAGAA
jgi:predicted O-linked N-acetylglucosamine transferase (SPINDLY family)